MSGHNFIVPPMSRDQIILKANHIRQQFGISNDNFNISTLLSILSDGIDLFNLEIRSDDDMNGAEAYCTPNGEKIIFSDTVYEALCNKNHCNHQRSRFTAAHEIGHLVLHANKVSPMMPRIKKETPAYRSSEWQADTFASHFLMPNNRIPSNADAHRLSEIFNISPSAAQYRIDKKRKRLNSSIG